MKNNYNYDLQYTRKSSKVEKKLTYFLLGCSLIYIQYKILNMEVQQSVPDSFFSNSTCKLFDK